ncbi:MAG: DEAD/DEAH box helicase [Lachnospiraceae bacterium]
MNFSEFIRDNSMIEALGKQGITVPTNIQKDSYQPILEHKNIIARSETGSGKTLAYLLPLFEEINVEKRECTVLILVPTHELTIQVHQQISLLASNSGKLVRSVAIIGNGNINRQIEQLKTVKPHIIVGTSGRILELIKKKKISAHPIKTLVIDESDKMMDKNNLQPMLDVRKCLYKNIQILMYSASMNKKALEQGKQLTTEDVLIIRYQDKESIPENIKHLYVKASSRREKTDILRSVCSAMKPDRCIIFVNSQYDAEEVFQKLSYHHYKVADLTGDKDKNGRKNALDHFKAGKVNYLVSTDLASRGLHIDHVDLVINMMLPGESKDYLHRCGRCGRNQQNGICLSIITENELEHLKGFQKAFGINLVAKKLYNGQLVKG